MRKDYMDVDIFLIDEGIACVPVVAYVTEKPAQTISKSYCRPCCIETTANMMTTYASQRFPCDRCGRISELAIVLVA